MDNIGLSDRICEMDESDFYNTILDAEMDSESFDAAKIDLENYEMSADWLEFFDDPVVNDKMISEASTLPAVKSEHSYSIGKESDGGDLLMKVKSEPSIHTTLDDHPGPAINPKFLELNTSDVVGSTVITSQSSQRPRAIQTVTVTKQEPKVIFRNEPIVIEARRPAPQQSLLKPSTILLTKQNQIKSDTNGITLRRSSGSVFESDLDEGIYLNVMPMTPPGSGSDSESGISPRQSPTPSPVRQVIFKSSHREINPATAIYSQPIPTSGVLVLTEEEKRTLVSEGYPIPTKLPLSKIEEKNLKKVRRKIKNKISAQESRRKRKEYMDHLEKKMEDISRENTDLRKRCDKYEQSNQSLLAQLSKLQNMVKKLAPQHGTTQTGICLMVFVLCFAVFFGDLIPNTFGSGFGLGGISQPPLSNMNYVDLHSPSIHLKPSRTLLTVMEEERACGMEPWPLALVRKSYECIAGFITPPGIHDAGTAANISGQQFVVTPSALYEGVIDS